MNHCIIWYTSLQTSDQGYLKLETADFNKLVPVYLTTRYHSPEGDGLKTVTLLCAHKTIQFRYAEGTFYQKRHFVTRSSVHSQQEKQTH